MYQIVKELNEMWDKADVEEISDAIELLAEAREKTIVGLGAGRMGYSIRAFVMRLSHLGYSAYMLGDTSLPRVGADSVAIINTSSGETPSIKLYAEQCKEAGSRLVIFTSQKDSSIAKLGDLVVCMPKIESQQLMKSLFEQYSFLLFDHIAYQLFLALNLDLDWVEQNHSILE